MIQSASQHKRDQVLQNLIKIQIIISLRWMQCSTRQELRHCDDNVKGQGYIDMQKMAYVPLLAFST